MPYFPQIDDLQNFIYRCIENYTSGRHQERHGICSSYDPKTHTAKFLIQPEGVETGDVPIEVDHVGKGWGIVVGPTPGPVNESQGAGSSGGGSSGSGGQQQEAGDQFIIRYQEGEFDAGKAAKRVHDSTKKAPQVQSKEMLVQNFAGHHLFFKVEKDSQGNPKSSVRLAFNGDTSGQTPQGEQPPPNQNIGTFKFDKDGNQTSDSNQKSQTVTDSGGATQTHDGQGNYSHQANTITHNSTKGNISHTAANNNGNADIVHTAQNNITHTATKGNVSRTAQSGTITDTAKSIGHNGPTNVQGTLGVSQLLSANGGLAGLGGMSMSGLSQLLGGMTSSGGQSMSGGQTMSGGQAMTGGQTMDGLLTVSTGGANITGGLTADTATVTNGATVSGGLSADTSTLTQHYTVATLPSASANKGMRTFVTNSNLAPLNNYGQPVAGGSPNAFAPVFSDGTSWLIG